MHSRPSQMSMWYCSCDMHSIPFSLFPVVIAMFIASTLLHSITYHSGSNHIRTFFWHKSPWSANWFLLIPRTALHVLHWHSIFCSLTACRTVICKGNCTVCLSHTPFLRPIRSFTCPTTLSWTILCNCPLSIKPLSLLAWNTIRNLWNPFFLSINVSSYC